MHQFGLENEDFGRYTVVARKHAATNPNAWFYERPISLEDHQNSRWIVEPILRLLDCCQRATAVWRSWSPVPIGQGHEQTPVPIAAPPRAT